MPRPLPEVNSSSQADIAFMLLIFFLVTTTMDVDSGISRVLPPAVEENDQQADIKERNVMSILVNSRDALQVENQRMRLTDLKDKVKEFFTNPNNDPTLPETREEEIEYFGLMNVSKGVISLQNARGTTYGMYIKVQNEIARAVNELRNSLAVSKFGKPFDDLNLKQQQAIAKIYKNAVSEAEPDVTKIE